MTLSCLGWFRVESTKKKILRITLFITINWIKPVLKLDHDWPWIYVTTSLNEIELLLRYLLRLVPSQFHRHESPTVHEPVNIWSEKNLRVSKKRWKRVLRDWWFYRIFHDFDAWIDGVDRYAFFTGHCSFVNAKELLILLMTLQATGTKNTARIGDVGLPISTATSSYCLMESRCGLNDASSALLCK